MLKTTLSTGKSLEFDLFNMANFHENRLDIIVLVFSSVTLIFTFVFGIVNKFSMNKAFAIVLVILYVSFIASSSWFSIRSSFKVPVYN